MKDGTTIRIRRLRTGSVFKIMAAGCMCFFVPLFVLMGVLASFGIQALTWNGAPIFGIKALVASPFIGMLAGAMFAGMGGVGMSMGLWLYSKFRPLTLDVVREPAAAHIGDWTE